MRIPTPANSYGNAGLYALPASCCRSSQCSLGCSATFHHRPEGRSCKPPLGSRVGSCLRERRTRASRRSSVSIRPDVLKQRKRQIRISRDEFYNTLREFPWVFRNHVSWSGTVSWHNVLQAHGFLLNSITRREKVPDQIRYPAILLAESLDRWFAHASQR